jgi:predicted helicase
MTKIEQILLNLSKISENTREKGDLFEKFVIQYLTNDPYYSELIEFVWMWKDFPYNNNEQDTGIDIVLKIKDSEDYWAIQCKFYSNTNKISKEDIDTFLSASSRSFGDENKKIIFVRRILFTTTDNFTKNAYNTISFQNIPVTIIGLNELINSPFDWDKFDINKPSILTRKKKYELRQHQKEAFDAVIKGFNKFSKGKLIMACGSGKTFTSLKIAENYTNEKSKILVLVPSISLLSQTMKEWAIEKNKEVKFIAICSDDKASNISDEDLSLSQLVYPATTNFYELEANYLTATSQNKSVYIFSTYQSVEQVSKLQKKLNFEFDLIICDEAHRTTGVSLSKNDESYFTKIHDNDFVKTKRRLYMTATPKIYSDKIKDKLSSINDAVITSMDDLEIFGPTFYNLSFSAAINQNILTDYKVLILAVDEKFIKEKLKESNTEQEIKLDDAIKMYGCWLGINKITSKDDDSFINDPLPMKRAVAFTNKISDSIYFKENFSKLLNIINNDDKAFLEVDHIDGRDNSNLRSSKLSWLRNIDSDNKSKILSNAKCLSEGVDVPSLDAVIFLNPRSSIVDIVQSVGRVMRKSEEKKYGYVILPVGIPEGIKPEEALKDNEKYKVIWQVLQALRSHDDRFDNTINKLRLNKNKPPQINIIGITPPKGFVEEQIALTETEFNDWRDKIYVKLVEKVGSRVYWENWAKDVSTLASQKTNEIRDIVERNKEIRKEFLNFVEELRKMINPGISENESIELLSQHIITKPIFEALFDNINTLENNSIALSLDRVLSFFTGSISEVINPKLNDFYKIISDKIKGIDNFEGKQAIIIELYENFFKIALPKQVEKLGIVYTPIEIVDFMISSSNFLLGKFFGKSLNHDEVNVLDPFTGTGTFLVRILQSDLIEEKKLFDKFKKSIYANEIVLLAYYIALINIEQAFSFKVNSERYLNFDNLVLTDTFQLSEKRFKDDNEYTKIMDDVFKENNFKANLQRKSKITLIIGNPPYSIGQKSANDDNANLKYDNLDYRIKETYSKFSKKKSLRSLYDSYIRAFRWASDRVENNGIISFISNGSLLDSPSMDGFRKSLFEEFNSIYYLNLKGNARTQGEAWKKQGGKIFGQGSRTSVGITFLIKRNNNIKDNFINYYEIEDYLDRKQKLKKISELKSIENMSFTKIYPNKNNEWIYTEDEEYENFYPLYSKNEQEVSFFGKFTLTGIATNRDPWLYNFSKEELMKNVKKLIANYNKELEYKKSKNYKKNLDPTKISWSRKLNGYFEKNKKLIFNENNLKIANYRPFMKQYLYYDSNLVETPSTWNYYINNRNLFINISGAGNNNEFSCFITDGITDLQYVYNCTSMPLYNNIEDDNKNLFSNLDVKEIKPKTISEGIKDLISSDLKKDFNDEDIFYYVYGILNNLNYLKKYKEKLLNSTPRLPITSNFEEISNFGKKLSKIHLGEIDFNSFKPDIEIKKKNYEFDEIIYDKSDKSIIFNNNIKIKNISEEVVFYRINSKNLLQWFNAKYIITYDSASGINKNPSTVYSAEEIFNLFLKYLFVVIETIKVVSNSPELILNKRK